MSRARSVIEVEYTLEAKNRYVKDALRALLSSHSRRPTDYSSREYILPSSFACNYGTSEPVYIINVRVCDACGYLNDAKCVIPKNIALRSSVRLFAYLKLLGQSKFLYIKITTRLRVSCQPENILRTIRASPKHNAKRRSSRMAGSSSSKIK